MGKRNISRRKFIQHGTCGAMATTTMYSTLLNLRASAAASMSDSTVIGGGDYKAMVCILLSGGNDSYNMLVPHTQSEYNDYAAIRGDQENGGVALSRGSLLPISPSNTPGRTFGLHPSMPRTRDMFNNGKCAFVANVGTLIESLTPQEFYAESKRTPLGLLSHSDQTQQWMTALPHERSGIGWGGRIADMVNDMNTDPNLSMNISMGGTNIFQTGVNTVEYAINPLALDDERAIRPIEDYFGEGTRDQQKRIAIDKMLDRTYADIYENTYINTMRSARDGWLTYQEALDNITLATPFIPQNDEYADITYSMGWIAKMIAAREVLGYKRQTFFVDYGGFDNHDEVINAQAGKLAELDHAMNQFQLAMEELSIGAPTPAARVENCVTSFVISDFARTLGSNGNGTDHAWGGNVMTYGGPDLVNGGQIYGEYPLSLNPNNNPQDLGGGIIVPTTSADVYFAEIAKWFGVSDSNLQTIFPNLVNFYDYQKPGDSLLGFLNT